MLIDSHAHILHENMDTDRIVRDMKADGLEKIITIGTTVKSSIEAVKFCENHEDVYCAVGVHPDYADEMTEEDYQILDKLASSKKVVAIGEIGLDYHTNDQNKEKQKELFIRQIQIAKKHSLPICIHTRNAAFDTYWILKQNIDGLTLPSVMHCFSENSEYAKAFMSLGFYISFSGNITYKKSDRSVLKVVPLDKMLVETDSPYLSPEPLRGRVNEPSRVKYTAARIAEELGISIDELSKYTVENTYRVFKKMERTNKWQ